MDVVSAAVAGDDAGHGRQRVDVRAMLLGEVEVVLHEGVLRVVAAAGHALATPRAGMPSRPFATEVGVVDGLALALAVARKEDPDRRVAEGVSLAHLLSDLADHLVRGRVPRVGDDAEHPGGLVVVGRQLGLPVGDVAPLWVVVEGGRRLVKGVCVDERATADPGSAEDEAVVEQVDPLDPVAAQRRREQVVAHVEARVGQVGVLETWARFEHGDRVALLGEA